MYYLALGIAPLILSPVIFWFLRTLPQMMELIDGVILTSVIGLFLLDIFPEMIAGQGIWAFFAAVIGFLGPFLIEKLSHRVERSTHTVMVVLITLGLALHEAMDGAVLAPSVLHDSAHGTQLAWAVLLHRIPGALFLWWFFRPRLGLKYTILLISALGLSTTTGFFLGEGLARLFPTFISGLFQSFVGGSILHVVFHGASAMHHHHDHDHDHAEHHQHIHAAPNHHPAWLKVPNFPSLPHFYHTLGCILGIVLVVWGGELVHQMHGGVGTTAHHDGTLEVFWHYWLESSPALLIGYLASGILGTFILKSPIAWLSQGKTWMRSFKGVALGLPIPICSCGVVPLYSALWKKGAPPAAAFAFLLATPELGIDAILLSIPLLGGNFTLVRVVAAFILALLVGVLMEKFFIKTNDVVTTNVNRQGSVAANKQSILKTLTNIWHEGFEEVFDKTMPWILFGIILAAMLQPILNFNSVLGNSPLISVILAALIGLPLYVCASGSTPLAAAFLLGGLSPGATLAFLLVGPATNLTTFAVLQKFHGRKVALAFTSLTFSVTVFMGWLINLLPLKLSLSKHAARHSQSSISLLIGVLLLALIVWALMRKGARSLMSEVVSEQFSSGNA